MQATHWIPAVIAGAALDPGPASGRTGVKPEPAVHWAVDAEKAHGFDAVSGRRL